MIKHLNHLNKKYWKMVPANKTTSPGILPSEEILKKILPQAHVLDVGCGDGKLSEWLSKKGFLVSAIDINKNAIKNRQKKKTKVDYSIQDITNKTTFGKHSFDLICFRFTLANIHRNEWPALQKETNRLASSGGFLWLAEPLVSKDYKDRYKLSKKLLGDERTIFVFKDIKSAKKVTTVDQLKTAINKEEVLRISRHYSKKELTGLFPNFEIIHKKIIKITSPSGFIINTFTVLLKKGE